MLDTRMVRGTWLNIIPWFADYFTPMVAKKGIVKTAFVNSSATFSKNVTEKALKAGDHFAAQTFMDYQSAENWLLGKSNQELFSE